MMEKDVETFYADLVDMNGTIRATIPYKIAEILGLKAGSRVKVWVKKYESDE